MDLYIPEIKLKNEAATDEPHRKECPEHGSIIFSPRWFWRHVNDLTAHLFQQLVISKVEKVTGPQIIVAKVPKSFWRP